MTWGSTAEQRSPSVLKSPAGAWIPYVAVGGTLLLTLLVALYVDSSAEEKDRYRFEREVGRLEIAVEKTFENYTTVLRSVAGLYASDPVVTRSEFHEFVLRMRIAQYYPGMLGVGFTRRLDPSRVAAFEALMRSQGVPDYTIKPAGLRPEYCVIQYLEPEDRRNRVALGYDMLAESTRRVAMEFARDHGTYSVSERVRLIQEIDPEKQAGFLIYVPVFSRGVIPPTVAERRAALIGFAYAPFRADDFFRAILRSELASGVDVHVYTGAPSPATLMHQSRSGGGPAALEVTRTVDIGRKPWTIVVSSGPAFEAASERRWIPWIILGGTLLALLLFLLTRSIVRNRAAIQTVLSDLRDREERFRLLSRATNDAIRDWDLANDRMWWNEGVRTLFGYANGEVGERADWWMEKIHPDDSDRVLGEISAVIEGEGKVWRGEYRFRRSDGGYAQVLDRGWVVRNEKGTATRMIGAILDVSPLLEAEQKLAESERRFRTLVTNTSTIVWRTDTEGQVVAPLTSWEHFTGQSFEQYRARGWVEAIHPEEQQSAVGAWQAAVQGRRPFRTSYRLKNRDGEYRWVEVNGAPILDDHGEIIEWTGTATDVHTQREAEQELAYRAHLIRTMAESVTTCLFLMDDRGMPTYMNEAAKEVTGYPTLEEIKDRPLHDSVHYKRPDGSPYPLEECPIDRASAEVVALREQEELFVRKDGTLFPVIYSVSPLVRDGRTIGAVIEVRDVTEAKRAEAAVREAAERFRFLAESMPQKVFTAAPSGEVNYFNRQWFEYTGLSFEEIRDWGWTIFIHPEDLEENVRRWREALESGASLQIEHRARRADGVYHWHLTRALAMRDKGGQIAMWIGSSTDIEEQKQTEKTLERLYHEAESANRAKDEFLATVSHELRTPMTAILGWSHLLVVGGLDDESATEAVETIQRSAKIQAQLIDDMLDVSRIATGKMHLHMEDLAVVPIVRNAVRAISPAAEAKGITIDADLPEQGPRVRADATRLQQIFWNLLSNAVKFTPNGGKVRVRVYPDEGEAVFEVSDTGKGITGEFLPFVFDRFRQEETTSTRHYSGLGLGLSIVKQLVEMHGGQVLAESGGEGAGSTFRVRLPIRAVDLDATLRGKRKVAPWEPSAIDGIRVLVVDDDADARRVVSAILEQGGATVVAAGSATEALERWSDAIDVLVTDIAMPENDGYFLLESLHSGAGRPMVPAIALTAYGRPSDAERIRAAGFRRHLVKPVEAETLISAVAEVAREG